MIAYGINEEGKREILGFASYEKESKETWKAFALYISPFKGLSRLFYFFRIFLFSIFAFPIKFGIL